MKKDIQFVAGEKGGIVSGLLLKSPEAKALLVLAHGAGAGMRHRFMEDVRLNLATAPSRPFVISFLHGKAHQTPRHRSRVDGYSACGSDCGAKTSG
jgi:predicted alpha/beta-hydrolase family hydrolase